MSILNISGRLVRLVRCNVSIGRSRELLYS